MQIIKPTKQNISIVVDVLNRSGIVICPTDTVYGFLALAENKKAVDKIFKIKKRLKSKTLPVFINSIKMAKELAEILVEQERILKDKWPGKYTFILKLRVPSLRGAKATKQSQRLSKLCIGGDGVVALRIPKYKFLNDLLKIIGKPLVQTSVNISGKPPINKISEIIEVFGKSKNIDIIIDAGILKNPKQSRIIDLTGKKKKIIRK
ncbi:MAG: threonylcarbamoyl-AMP synthase [Candidatus Staskawiczbacteria bacterium RIFOXYB2_FULL_32_9]|uniref:L-threonylcarbamoyladenylate synthase n=1 Tax=Candidatus Staskawiczbacteria bacterium RIFOXYD1_FULL_32_13 TaxID=1802234 RepID=A0A1G2JM28_9BACT|nr:MAG: Sua5/YciO/YrdC/YwlC family protein [Parcubacteria group bacterium GW2011_GWC2_32_10]OGZ78403.1 MAG: threonylcarbamoyl-AMP synthase [Candidatus Staskawiczbacteria bacterium RIFOXYA2_FULL_32_7]OGZ78655.1 MAG: threonylcarbamoyl-AMP synthase [Candidatus Staskawiczbacteria bacterium RIFOXYB1_FULL_32_11]OGZ81552.1 MAG: threonylcarbamoyl-AMP synthase [Candidatus Staskawiczbacteria bacterium RIFOXYB2_FULL_32_9]OGZ86894.1 MAG: threonylcarbamoyl-AMP synthase [Candidatus Staskawiczbacteria bacteri